MNLNFRAESKSTNPNPNNDSGKRQSIDLGNGSDLIYIPRFLSFEESRKWFDYLNKEIPWTRPTIRVFGRSCVQVGFSSFLENFLETEQQDVWLYDVKYYIDPLLSILFLQLNFFCNSYFDMSVSYASSISLAHDLSFYPALIAIIVISCLFPCSIWFGGGISNRYAIFLHYSFLHLVNF